MVVTNDLAAVVARGYTVVQRGSGKGEVSQFQILQTQKKSSIWRSLCNIDPSYQNLEAVFCCITPRMMVVEVYYSKDMPTLRPAHAKDASLPTAETGFGDRSEIQR